MPIKILITIFLQSYQFFRLRFYNDLNELIYSYENFSINKPQNLISFEGEIILNTEGDLEVQWYSSTLLKVDLPYLILNNNQAQFKKILIITFDIIFWKIVEFFKIYSEITQIRVISSVDIQILNFPKGLFEIIILDPTTGKYLFRKRNYDGTLCPQKPAYFSFSMDLNLSWGEWRNKFFSHLTIPKGRITLKKGIYEGIYDYLFFKLIDLKLLMEKNLKMKSYPIRIPKVKNP